MASETKEGGRTVDLAAPAPGAQSAPHFQLDTSGTVRNTPPAARQPIGQRLEHIRWLDLDPFTQGYIEALFATLKSDTRNYRWTQVFGSPVVCGFHMLAPETLARIIEDCAHLQSFAASGVLSTSNFGRIFWNDRQAGEHPILFPPLTVTLGDDGKVYLSAIAGSSASAPDAGPASGRTQ